MLSPFVYLEANLVACTRSPTTLAKQHSSTKTLSPPTVQHLQAHISNLNGSFGHFSQGAWGKFTENQFQFFNQKLGAPVHAPCATELPHNPRSHKVHKYSIVTRSFLSRYSRGQYRWAVTHQLLITSSHSRVTEIDRRVACSLALPTTHHHSNFKFCHNKGSSPGSQRQLWVFG
jgi:hypothetical protein